jgi:hypothetical protein
LAGWFAGINTCSFRFSPCRRVDIPSFAASVIEMPVPQSKVPSAHSFDINKQTPQAALGRAPGIGLSFAIGDMDTRTDGVKNWWERFCAKHTRVVRATGAKYNDFETP